MPVLIFINKFNKIVHICQILASYLSVCLCLNRIYKCDIDISNFIADTYTNIQTLEKYLDIVQHIKYLAKNE